VPAQQRMNRSGRRTAHSGIRNAPAPQTDQHGNVSFEQRPRRIGPPLPHWSGSIVTGCTRFTNTMTNTAETMCIDEMMTNTGS